MSFRELTWRTSGYAVVGTAPNGAGYRWAGQEISDDGPKLTPEERRQMAVEVAAVLNAVGEPTLTDIQSRVLAVIREHSSSPSWQLSRARIAELTGIAESTVEHSLARLEHLGLISRPPPRRRTSRPVTVPIPQEASR